PAPQTCGDFAMMSRDFSRQAREDVVVGRGIEMSETGRSRESARGFTLIELLVVMAITVILLGLIFGPLIQGFNLTNRARVQVLTQDVARRVIEVGGRDISNGLFVFDQHYFYDAANKLDIF